ncbi:hypothetical protein [Tabrizicola sp.]|uniref:hypothetical protein n=1 Tax=Tabrizicola sp. TaxID=2005166 RepID=UPI003F4121B6
MRRPIRLAVLVCFAGLLGACQLAPQGNRPGQSEDGVTPNAVTGGEIEVTALDAPPDDAAAAPTSPAAKPAGTDTAAPQAAPTAPGAEAEPAVAEAEPAPAPEAEVEEVPAVVKSELQLACEKKKGKWAKVGKANSRACVFTTRDSGKRCERESQCEGVCLARSGTCSPIKPLYGCNEILQDDGRRVTLCLE